ncbi:hypothetical protein M404DRAFT_28856 [Pisolithus tinctorius Marx 270]|uniref:Uncharacterized protein n=1 Tax=Pisolithus tinctorius Marx 270 TaxID=870435 RepID=A0A0C3NK25_PISTI|nr:hypothetical protein M404DRAFT_28856 [Pisolithus tinctorius Marx 270]
MRTQAQSQREVTENLTAALANLHQLPSIVKHTSEAGCSDLHPTAFHTPSPCNQDDGPDPDPNNPDSDPNSGGSSDGDIPKDPAELPKDPLVALARAVHALVQSSSCTGDSTLKTKVCKPDTFNGSDPKKLHEFLMQCKLNFQDCPHAFHSNRVKDYGVGALCHCFYCRLPDHIKDKITQVRKPSTLAQLHKLAQTIDACYWECKAEILCTTKSTTDKWQSSSSDNKSKSSSSASAPKPDTKGKGKQKDLPKSKIAHLLGKDGKLTSTECQ